MSKPDKPLFEHRRERRGILGKGLAALAAAPLAGCDVISNSETGRQVLRSGEHLSYAVHRLLGRKAMAQEFPPADIAPVFRANGTLMPPGPEYAAMMASNFTAWRLKVGGLVNKPLELDLDELRALPARTQITRHDCVEGWSCIGQWKGVRLSHLLDMAGVKAQAKFAVFHCLDKMEEDDNKSMYYESIDLDDAFHEQTILAWELNGKPLPVQNGAPLRARIERQLGYKNPKYLHAVELVASLDGINGGNGGYWEDQGYNWYGGI